MKCWPGWARVASTTRWYIVTAWASLVRERSRRSSSTTRSSIAKVLTKPQVSSGLVASSAPAIVPSPRSTTSCMKRLKNTAWRASSTCWVARKYFCSSRGAALEVGEALVPVDPVLREVDLGRAPVAALPALVQVLVRDLIGGDGIHV